MRRAVSLLPPPYQGAAAAPGAAGRPDGGADAAVIEQSWCDPERFATLFDRHADEIHRYAARRLGLAGGPVRFLDLAAAGARSE